MKQNQWKIDHLEEILIEEDFKKLNYLFFILFYLFLYIFQCNNSFKLGNFKISMGKKYSKEQRKRFNEL